MITVAKMTVPKAYSMRPGMLIETCESLQLDPPTIAKVLPHFANDPEAVGPNVLEVTGYIRRRNLNPHHLVHIAGSGTYKILRIDVNPVKMLEVTQRKPDIETPDSIRNAPCLPRFMYDPAAVPPEEIEEVGMNEAMSVASDDLSDDFDDMGSQNSMDTDEGMDEPKTVVKRLPKGTSDYQADWLLDSDSEKEDKEIIGSDDELESDDDEDDDGEDEEEDEDEDEMDWAEEQKQLQLTKGMN